MERVGCVSAFLCSLQSVPVSKASITSGLMLVPVVGSASGLKAYRKDM